MKTIRNADEFPKNIPVYIFGSGMGGRIIYESIRNSPDVQLRGFIDNNKKSEEMFGTKIFSFKNFLEVKEDSAAVVIASQYYRDIALQLRAAKFEKVWNGYPWIEAILQRRVLMKRRTISIAVALPIAALLIWMLAL